jgi:hypothetical protein
MTASQNILNVYNRATEEELQAGRDWYSDANALARELSPRDVYRAAGVIAAFSPMCPWNRNVELACNTFASGIATGHTKQFNTFAQRIHDGEYAFDVLKGQKTRAFTDAIATSGMTDMVTIDRHAHDIAMGKAFPNNRKIGIKLYRELAFAYSEAANKVNIPPCTLQATTWVTWRREQGILHAG